MHICPSRPAVWLTFLLTLLLNSFSPVSSLAISPEARRAFIRNDGQYPPQVLYYFHDHRGSYYFTAEGVVFDLVLQSSWPDQIAHPESPGADSLTSFSRIAAAIDLTYEDANPFAELLGHDRRFGRHHYITGAEPSTWILDTPMYDRIVYHDLYEGLDLVYYVDDDGNLSAESEYTEGQAVELQPRWEGNEGLEIAIDGRILSVEKDSPVWAKTGNFDPALIAGSYLGGSSIDAAFDLDLAPNGDIVVTGYTFSTNFPTTVGVYQTNDAGNADVFVSRFDPTGSNLIFSTYLGGSDFEDGQAVDVADDGTIFVAGKTRSADFPTSINAYDNAANGSHDVFVARLSADGANLLFSTYLGSGDYDEAHVIRALPGGEVVIAGRTFSQFYRTTPGAYDVTYNGLGDAFLTKLDPTGTQLVFSTVIGGWLGERIWDFDQDASGNYVITGITNSSDFPTTTGTFDSTASDSGDIFVAKISSDASTLIWSTLLGETDEDQAQSVVVSPAGPVYVAGHTRSPGLPTHIGAFMEVPAGSDDAYVVRLNGMGTKVQKGTYFGGTGIDLALDVKLDLAGNVVVLGHTTSQDFPTTLDSFDPTFNGGSFDGFVTVLDPGLNTVIRSTYVGGSVDEFLMAGAIDPNGLLVIAGQSSSDDFPVTAGGYDATLGSNLVPDAVLLILDPEASSTDIETVVPVARGQLTSAPNPFNPVTRIRYNLPEAADVTLEVVAPSGRRVAVLDRGYRPQGAAEVSWDGRDDAGRPVASGAYFVRLTAGSASWKHKIVLVK
ncbi:MAG: hypothetical protein HKN20_09085 [Gemmatimonadetes bacterium]|nr:hypothetical protein [Gemmatimonadota bacterium]